MHFADLSLAYQTLSNETSRKEYDEYISQSRFTSNYAMNDEDDEEAKAEKARRRKERGKKRYEEDFSFVNDEFYSAWKNRTGATQKEEAESAEPQNLFDGKDISVDLSISFQESL
jgi:DnaJ-class molecular chaperone